MKKLKGFVAFLLIFTVAYGFSLKHFPKQNGRVSDFEEIYSESEIKSLDTLIWVIGIQKPIDIAVVTLNSNYTNKDNFDKFTLNLAKEWSIGEKVNNNGILIGISKSMDYVKIHSGSGIERRISEAETKAIILKHMKPEFRKGKYYDGTRAGIVQMIMKLM